MKLPLSYEERWTLVADFSNTEIVPLFMQCFCNVNCASYYMGVIELNQVSIHK